MTTTPRTVTQRFARSLAASAVVGVMLPVAAAAPAHAGDKQDPAYAGFSTHAVATPVRLEIYEPTIPIPASPQAEVELGYSTVEADSGSSMGRASYLWPGDAVGEGFKTIIENLGLPKELSGPLGKDGYPNQVNSSSPSGESSQADEPFPGMVMRTNASAEKTVAQTGYSTDCQVDDAGSGPGGGGGGTPGLPPLPGVPGVPGVPGLPGLPGSVGSLSQLLAPSADSSRRGVTTSKHARAAAKAGEPESSCQIPAELAALVDFGGYVSTSSTTNTGSAVGATSRAALSDVELLGGVITISDVRAKAASVSDGDRGKPSGAAGYGTLAIAGQEFTIGPDGIEAAGQKQPIPGLPDDPAKALAQLGVTITVPKPSYERDGDKATSDVAGLVVQIDTHQLRQMLDPVPFDEIVGAVPDEAGQLKSLLGAAVHLSPRFVITLGDASTVVDTVKGIDVPSTPTSADPGSTTGGGGGGATDTSATSPPSGATTGAPGGAAPAGDANADGDLTGAAPMGAGLPPLFSIPGALLFGGLALAAAGGSYFRKLGVLALGGTGSCPHGLDSGLPDLRKA
jgi:hypothetical protein